MKEKFKKYLKLKNIIEQTPDESKDRLNKEEEKLEVLSFLFFFVLLFIFLIFNFLYDIGYDPSRIIIGVWIFSSIIYIFISSCYQSMLKESHIKNDLVYRTIWASYMVQVFISLLLNDVNKILIMGTFTTIGYTLYFVIKMSDYLMINKGYKTNKKEILEKELLHLKKEIISDNLALLNILRFKDHPKLNILYIDFIEDIELKKKEIIMDKIEKEDTEVFFENLLFNEMNIENR